MMRFDTFASAISRGDPGYQAVNFAAYNLGGGIWLVNLFCGAVYVGAWAASRLDPAQPLVGRACDGSLPAERRGHGLYAAIGGDRSGPCRACRDDPWQRTGGSPSVLIAGLFHRTAISVLPLVLLVSTRYRLINIVAVAIIFWTLFNYMLSDELGTLRQHLH